MLNAVNKMNINCPDCSKVQANTLNLKYRATMDAAKKASNARKATGKT